MKKLEKTLAFFTPLFIAQALNVGFITLGNVLSVKPGILASSLTFFLFFLIANHAVEKYIVARYKQEEDTPS